MLEVLERTVSVSRDLVESFDPSRLSGAEAKSAVCAFVELEKLASAGRLLASARLDETGAWVGDGTHRDIEAFLAATAGTSVGAAKAAMGTARRVRAQPAVRDALRAGALSPSQVDAVSAAVKADPDAADELLGVAKTAGHRGLRQACDRVTAAARSRETEAANDERIHRERYLRHRTVADGSGRIEIQGPLDRIAQILASLEPIEREIFEANRAAQNLVHAESVAFDALVGLCREVSDAGAGDQPGPVRTQKTRGSRPLAAVVLHISYDAYLRGWTVPGEICEIEGYGPISVANAYRLASDSFLKTVITNNVDVTLISHLGRTIPAHLRSAIEVRDRACVMAGCEMDRHLEIDHNIPVAAAGKTELANLARLCHHHHAEKTRRDLRRIGPLGSQSLVTKAEFNHLTRQRAGPAPPRTRAA